MSKNHGAPLSLVLRFDKGSLLLIAPVGFSPCDYFASIPLRFDARVNHWRCDGFYYRELIELGRQAGFTIADEASEFSQAQWRSISIPPLRQKQTEACQAWMKTQRGVVVLPTGVGKTELALAIMRDLQTAALIVSPVRDLMYQWQRRIQDALGYDPGIIGDSLFDLRPVSVTTYHSAAIHMEKIGGRFPLIIFDECHHLPSSTFQEAALMSIAPYRLGLTATPDGAGDIEKKMEKLIGPVVYRASLQEVKGDILADYHTLQIPVSLTEKERLLYNNNVACFQNWLLKKKQEFSDYDIQDLLSDGSGDPGARAACLAFHRFKAIEDRAAEKMRVLEDIFRLHPLEPVIVFAGSNIMAREISRRFLIPCLLSHCGKDERRDILDGFRNGGYKAVVANRVLDEGVDVPEAKVAVVLGGLGSTRQAKQRLGRILRKSGNKRGFLYEVVCRNTGEVKKSLKRRKSDAYLGTQRIHL